MSDSRDIQSFLARVLRTFSVPIILAWLALAVVLTVFVPPLEQVGDAVSVPLSPADAPAVVAMKRMGQKFNEYDSDNVAMVILVGTRDLDDGARRYYDDLLRRLRQDTKHVQHIADFWGQRITSAGVESADARAAYALINLAGDLGGARGNEAVESVRKIVAASKPPDGINAYVTGHGASVADAIDAADKGAAKLAPLAIAVIAIMLMIFYRSITTVLVMLFIVFIELATARGLIAFLGFHHLLELSTFSVGLLTALVIAAGTDYAIFLIGRYHEARNANDDRESAYYIAFRSVVKVILGSGLTIIGATFCLRFTRLNYFNSMGVPSSLALVMVVAAGIILAPAVLTVASRFGLLEPKRRANTRRWRRLATAIVRWPVPIRIAALAMILIGTLGLIGYNPGYDNRNYVPESVPSSIGYVAAERHFTAARLNPDILMITADHDLRNPRDMIVLDRVARNIFHLPGIERVQSITRPLGTPLEHASIPFQVSMQSAPIQVNLQYLKSQVADTLKLSNDLGAMVATLERTYNLTRQLADSTHETAGDIKELQALTEKVRDELADFDDFSRPIRNYFYWEEHCFDIPVCWALKSLYDALDGVENLTDATKNLVKDSYQIDTLMHGLLAQLPPMIAISKSIQQTALSVYSSFSSFVTQMGRLTDTSSVMGEAFDAAKVDDWFYMPPEVFDNPDFQLALRLMVSPDGKAARMIITHDADPATTQGISIVDGERKAAVEALKLTSLANAKVDLAGTAATYKDVHDGMVYDLMIVAIASIVLITIIMLIMTRGVIATLVIVGTVVLSLGAAFGLSVLIWQHLLQLQLHWLVLGISLIILLAVGSDYNLLLVSRFQEEIGAGLKTGIIRGMASTGQVVTAAGLVFAFTMASQIISDLRVQGQIGTTIALGLLVDTLIVRSLLTPSIAVSLGRWFWWPRIVAHTRPFGAEGGRS